MNIYVKISLVVVLVLIFFGAIAFPSYQKSKFMREIAAQRPQLCERICKQHGGWAYYLPKREGFASTNNYCVCEDGLEVLVP